MEESEESRVVERCREGDLTAYRWIYERYEKPLLRTAYRLLGSPQEAEDAVQESFLKLYRGIGGFRRGASFSTYFFRILINTCTDIRRKRRRKDYQDMEMDRLPAASRENSGLPLGRIIDRLPERMKACFILNAVEEFTLREVADTLQINVGTVKANVHRARKKLRTWLTTETAEVES
ncbi:MAG: RNA polymerase sigma factor [Candidatus Aminicenantes bacterium]|nr:RNA polymerase sigma factor [Candidatus Aminicenantes bacterium]